MGVFSQLSELSTAGAAFLSIETVLVIFLTIYIKRLKSSRGSEGVPDVFLLRYDENQGVFYYPINAEQRKFGYCELYDEGAAGLGIVIDCEPVRFTWGGRNWLIEMWKGQYGLAVGAEIGVYSTEDLDLEPRKLIYLDTKTLLEMEITLKSKEEQVFTRREKTWWLTGFVPGMFAWPDQLRVEAKIVFPEEGMAGAFADELHRMGYKTDEIYTRRETVKVLFTEPKSPQPRSRGVLGVLTQKRNEFFVKTYNEAAGEFASIDELLKFLKRFKPKLYRYLTKGVRGYKVPLSNKSRERGGK